MSFETLKNEREMLAFIWGYLVSFSSRLRLIANTSPPDRILGEAADELDDVRTAVGAALLRVQGTLEKGEGDGTSR